MHLLKTSSPLTLSAMIHGLLFLILVFVLYSPGQKEQLRLVKIKMIEKQTTVEKPEPLKKIEPAQTVDIQTKKKVVKPKPKKNKVEKRVFGASKNSLTSTRGKVSSVKAGNTITKEVDNEKLKGNEVLPEPVAEYLVSEMPRIKTRPLIKYPEAARSSEIEGPVVLDILIDEEGKVRQATVAQGLAELLDAEALKVINDFEFYPAKINDKNVPIRIRFTVNFVLEE